jgi:DNA polymerase III subunit epsilon
VKLSELPLFFLDLQTTGATPAQGQILEIAWGTLNPADDFETLIQLESGNSLPRQISRITGISDKDLESGALSLEKVRELLQTFINLSGRRHAVIHFARFENSFLQAANLHESYEILCTYEIARRLLPNIPSRGIRGLAGYFGAPSLELKRARHQVQATRVIWEGLIASLAERGIQTLSDLRDWLQKTPLEKRQRYEYRMSSEKRLALPRTPGIYKMLGKQGQILYVGKATSLRDRVNSYFRGQKGRDAKKLEMLTQVWDIEVVPCQSPLEAALLETDEIKKYHPPYNIALRRDDRKLVYYSRDFSDVSFQQDPVHPYGPFSSRFTLSPILEIASALKVTRKKEIQFSETLFFNPIEPDLLKEGFFLFCKEYGLQWKKISSPRTLIAWSLHEARKQIAVLSAEEAENSVEEIEDAEESEVPSPEEVAAKFYRTCIHAGKAWIRSRALTRLLNGVVSIENKNLAFREGKLISDNTNANNILSSTTPWKELTIDDYDRMSVLFQALEVLRKKPSPGFVDKI